MPHATRAGKLLAIVGLLFVLPGGPAAQQPSSTIANDKIFAAIGVAEDATVCEIGAGNGELTVAAARAVGPSGRVYTNELGDNNVKSLRARAAASGLSQITVVTGHETRTNFPDAACDALFMRNVYHHFTDPSVMNASIAAALKPGGRLAIVDFAPTGREAAAAADRAGRSHGVTAASVSRELAAAGFEIVSTETGTQRWFMVVARKPQG